MPKSMLTLILVLACASAWGQAYKWRDANGNTQYSDVPPPPGARDVQQLRRPSGAGNAGAPPARDASKSYTEKDAEFRKRLVEKQEAEAKQAKANEDEQVRKRNCEQAQGQLAALDSGQRMVRLTTSGERVALDDQERSAARADAVKAVESWCK